MDINDARIAYLGVWHCFRPLLRLKANDDCSPGIRRIVHRKEPE